MVYINFKEERSVLRNQIRKRKNHKLYEDIINEKVRLVNYIPDKEYSYKNIYGKQIGTNKIIKENEFKVLSDKDIIAATFIKCKFTNIKFSNCKFIGCIFEECVFGYGGVVFDKCIFIKEESEKLPSLNKKDNLGCSFNNCNIYTKFLNCDL